MRSFCKILKFCWLSRKIIFQTRMDTDGHGSLLLKKNNEIPIRENAGGPLDQNFFAIAPAKVPAIDADLV
jgi:hypothetical protein